MGPGVTPVIEWEGDGLSPWTGGDDQLAAQQAANELWDAFMLDDTRCEPETGRS